MPSRTVQLALAATAFSALLHAQSPTMPRSLVTSRVDATRLVALSGNVRSAANAANDRGPVSASLALDHMLLQLQRSPEKERELAKYIDELHTAGSPSYHQWLTPQQLRAQYGPTDSDLAAVTAWLTGSGFSVNNVSANGMVIDFSGTAATVRAALHTEIHTLNVNGEAHIANMQDPQIPVALAGVVKGVVSLHDFHPHMLHKAVTPSHVDAKNGGMIDAATASPDYTFTSGGTYQAVVPGDLATIYNLKPLFAAGISGQGQTVVVIEDTNVYSTADFTTFRSKFGLSSYTSGNLTQVHPGSGCTNPGSTRMMARRSSTRNGLRRPRLAPPSS